MMDKKEPPTSALIGTGHPAHAGRSAINEPFRLRRNFLGNQFVYLSISDRARGLSIGVNLNPVIKCNLHCAYCEIDRTLSRQTAAFSLERVTAELEHTLDLAQELRKLPGYTNVPEEFLQIRHVALSGDGEPTLASHFLETVEALVQLRALGRFPHFKIVLITNSTALDEPRVQAGLKCLTKEDEIWAKLDAGTQAYIKKISGSTFPLDRILNNILKVGRQRPIVIQSLFALLKGAEPSQSEIEQYALRLHDLKQAGAEISLVQIYSMARGTSKSGCRHLPLKSLSQIAHTVRKETGLRAEVF